MKESIMFAVGFVLCVIMFIVKDPEAIAYKKGQIDALTGKVKFKLITNPDSTKTWVEIEK